MVRWTMEEETGECTNELLGIWGEMIEEERKKELERSVKYRTNSHRQHSQMFKVISSTVLLQEIHGKFTF